MLWTALETDATVAAHLSRELGVSSVMGSLLAQRGLHTPEAAETYLRPRLALLEDPFALAGMEAAVSRLEQAVGGQESVVVFGDYDVDGVTSTVQLVSLLKRFGLEPRFSVPRRLEEGYGLSKEAIDRVFDGNVPGLFIALDCGTNAHEPIAYLKGLGVDVMVVDHHQAKVCLPGRCIVINPHVNDRADAPWRDLCTAGLVFKLLHAFLKRRREADDPKAATIQLKEYLDLVALGTIADLVPLRGENRILSWFGLRHMRANGREGVRALAEVSGIDSSQELVSVDISFKLGPRINASGRLADASKPIDLLLKTDTVACRRIAKELDQMNRDRQTIERRMAKDAEERAARHFADKPGIILFDESWHPGVVGIVASRVSRHFNKPCVILGADGEAAKGSGRSVSSVNLVEIFKDCADLLGHWGGHPMAAGVSLPVSAVPAFVERFNASLAGRFRQGLPEPSLQLAAWVRAEDLSERFLEEIDRLHPFGQGNIEPVFGIRDVRLDEPPEAFGESNFRFRMPLPENGGRGLSGVAWRMARTPRRGHPIDMACRFSWNYFRGNRYPQLTLVDWRPTRHHR